MDALTAARTSLLGIESLEKVANISLGVGARDRQRMGGKLILAKVD